MNNTKHSVALCWFFFSEKFPPTGVSIEPTFRDTIRLTTDATNHTTTKPYGNSFSTFDKSLMIEVLFAPSGWSPEKKKIYGVKIAVLKTMELIFILCVAIAIGILTSVFSTG